MPWKLRKVLILVVLSMMFFNALFVCFILPIVYPYGYVHYLYGIPVSLPHCKPSSEKYYLTISMILKNRVEYVAEWIEFHLMIGVQHIYIYDNDSTDNLSAVLRPYKRDNLVTIIPFPKQYITLIDGTKEILTQKLFLKDTIETHACETQWMAMIDSDEFILPGDSFPSSNTVNLLQILKRFEDYSSVVLPWLQFTSDSWITKPSNKLVLETYKRRWKKPKHTWKHILQPKRITRVYSVHNYGSISGYYSVNEQMKPFANWPAMLNGYITRHLYYADSFYTFDVLRLHHYKTKSAEDWESRILTGEVSGTDIDDTGSAVKAHWKKYFMIQNVESLTDNTTIRYVEQLRRRVTKRFHGTS